MDNQPYYKKYIPDVIKHFCEQYEIGTIQKKNVKTVWMLS